MKENKVMRNWTNWIVALCTVMVLGAGFGCGDSRVIYAGAECESDSDCALGLECFRGECSYPCRGALMCPVGMACNTATGYCEGTPMTECPGYGPDICDGLDNDCDGETDEGSVCQPCNLGEEIACVTGMEGVCSMGVQRCLGDRSGFGPCVPRHFADTPEICDDRIDNNCDGRVDESCACEGDGLPISCMIPGFFGACAEGQMFCLDDGTGYGPCQPLHFPSAEFCNGFDDNCDGRIDEGLLNACGSCGPITPEYCDGSDNDCDGSIDEDCECVDDDGRVCGTDVGACTTGVQRCMGGHWGLCLGVGPASETCNGADDDCDTTIDEDCECRAGETRPCGETMGECTTGTQTCVGGFWSTCSGVGPSSELCDGLDNDCDGDIDEMGCACTAGSSISCDTGLLGACATGQTFCLADGTGYGPCEIVVGSAPEVCDDGIDNDCDGRVDNGCTCATGETTPCVTGLDGICSAGRATCLADHTGFGPCVPTLTGVPEVCADGLDNDCDGRVDNGCTTPICLTPGSPEICDNGLDDDCDGTIDDGCSGPARYQHCWTLPAVASRVAFEGCSGWAILTGPGDGIDGRLVCTRSWSLIAEVTGASSFCFAVSLDPGQIIEYNSVSDLVPDYWGCVGPYPPGSLNGTHVATHGGISATFSLVDNRLSGCNFRYQRP